ncbi:MAG: GAF domain-containing protein [bacterium]|nr:GAF domain-containing protein [bacterium]
MGGDVRKALLIEDELHGMARLGLAVSQAKTLPEMADALVRAALDSEDIDLCNIFFRGADGIFRMRASAARGGLDAAQLMHHCPSFRPGEGLVGWVAETGRPSMIADVDRDERWVGSPWARSVGIASAAAFPIRRESEVSGVFVVLSLEKGHFDAESLKPFDILAGYASTAMEKLLLIEEIDKRAKRFAVLNELTGHIAADLNLPEVLNRIAQALAELLRGDCSRIYLREEGAEDYVLCAAGGLNPTPDRPFHFQPGMGITGRMVEKREAVLLGDLRAEPDFLTPEWIRKHGIHSYIGCPLIQDGRVVGALTCLARNLNHFSQEDLEFLEALAVQAMIAIGNASLHEAAEARIAELESLQKAAKELTTQRQLPELLEHIASGGGRLLGADRCLVLNQFLENAAGPVFFNRGLSEGYVELLQENPERTVACSAIRDRRLVFIPNLLEDERYPFPPEVVRKEGIASLLTLPLIHKGEGFGSLNFYWDAPRTLSDSQLNLAQAFADHVALAIQNAKLHEAAQERIAALESLQGAAKELTSQRQLPDLLERIALEGGRLLGTDRCAVMTKWPGTNDGFTFCSLNISERYVAALRENADQVLSSHVVEEKGYKYIRDVMTDERYMLPRKIAQEEKIVSLLALNLVYKGEVIGALGFHWGEQYDLSASKISLAQTFADHVVIAIENAKLHEVAQERIAALESLQRAAKSITSGLSLPEILKGIDAGSTTLLGSVQCLIIVRETETGEINFPYARGVSESHLRRLRENFDATMSRQVLNTPRTLAIADVWTDPRYPFPLRFPQEEGFRGLLICPLMHDGRAFGTLNLFWEDIHQFAEGELALAQAFADQAAVAIQRARLHEEVRRSRDFLDSVLRETADPVVITDENRRIIYWNSGAENLYGYSKEEAIGEHIRLLTAQEEWEAAARHARFVRKSGKTRTFDKYNVTKEKVKVPVSITLSPVKINKKVVAVAAIHKDLTDRIRAERVLRESEARFRRIFEASNDAIFVIDPWRDEILDANPTACRMLGYSREEFVGAPVSSIHSEDMPRLLRFARKVYAKGKGWIGKLNCRTKSGMAIPSEASASLIEIEGRTWMIVLVRDITERLMMEGKLRHREKLEALGQLAAGVAHDFNNVLSIILGRAELVQETVQAPEVLRTMAIIEKAARSGAQTVRRLRDFSRKRERRPYEQVSLNDVVRDVVEMTRPLWKSEYEKTGRKIEMEVTAGAEHPLIRGDPAEIQEALINLINNSIDAMPEGGRLSISTGTAQEGFLVSVRDTGKGMTPEMCEKVFEPFFTTKGDHGTGLGLSIVYRIMEQHGGSVEVESAPGAGTAVRLFFPLHGAAGG